ncbi:MAG: rRNA maturation RNase YbeY [Burkholderiales bacterium]
MADHRLRPRTSGAPDNGRDAPPHLVIPHLVIQYATRRRVGLPQRRSIQRWADAAIAGGFVVTIRFVDAIEARALNRRYRGKDYPTNVLTFSYDGAPAGKVQSAERAAAGARQAGDIVLCSPVIAKEARAQGKRLRAHYAHLIVHGLLHLQGYDHEREQDANRMESREREILAGLGYSDPYAPV